MWFEVRVSGKVIKSDDKEWSRVVRSGHGVMGGACVGASEELVGN